MSGRQVGRSNTYSHLNHPTNASFPAHAPGRTRCPSLPRTNSLKRSRTPSGSEFSSCSSPSEWPPSPSSPGLPLRRICMGRPYNSKCVETSHLAHKPTGTRKPTCRGSTQGLVCTEGPSSPSSPSFLDHLIKGISYLDRSTTASHTSCPQTALSLPRLAANCLERAANSIHLDHLGRVPTALAPTPVPRRQPRSVWRQRLRAAIHQGCQCFTVHGRIHQHELHALGQHTETHAHAPTEVGDKIA